MSITWSNSFSNSTDLSMFQYSDNASGGSVVIQSGQMKISSSVLDAYKTPILYASSIGMDEITKVSFYARNSRLYTQGCFPNVTLTYSDGSWFRVYLYNTFPWDGYTTVPWTKLYANNGYAIAFTSTNECTRLWNATSSGKEYVSAGSKFKVELIKNSDGSITVKSPSTASSYTVSIAGSFKTNKITAVEFGINKHWYNSSATSYVDDLTVTGKSNIAKAWTNVNGVWKQGEQYVNVSGVWKQGEQYVNANGVWKQSST